MSDYHLAITSWSGVTAGATHFYGYIEADDYDGEKIRVKRPVTDDERQEEGWRHARTTERFNDRDSLIAAAIETWRSRGHSGRLYRGLPIYENREVLDEVVTE